VIIAEGSTPTVELLEGVHVDHVVMCGGTAAAATLIVREGASIGRGSISAQVCDVYGPATYQLPFDGCTPHPLSQAPSK
jgi:hypothetical protein